MSFESFIAWRYLRAKRKIGLITIISAISVGGITIGVAALICVLSVFNGFNKVVKGLLVGFDPHLRITGVAGPVANPDSLLALVRSLPSVTAVAPYVAGRSAILHEEGLRVIQVRGMDKKDMKSAIGLGERIYVGQIAEPSATMPHPIVLGNILSYGLRTTVGDTISLLSQTGLEESLTQLSGPTIIRCVITGIFESNNKEYDSYYAYTDVATARQLFAIPRGVMGIEIRLADLEQAETMKKMLALRLGPGYRIETWQDLHRDLFAVMELERWAAFIILSLIIIVAVFNVLGSLTMTVIEKHRDIGVLKTMGASDQSIRRIFLYEGAFIGVIGTFAGILLGILVCYLQVHFQLFKLDNAVYLIAAIPVELRPLDIVIISVTSLVLSLTAAIYPARRASRVLPAEAVRWD